MTERLTGRVAMVTGAARGQGRAHAVRLAQDGADIVAFDVCAPFASTRYDPATERNLDETRRLVEKTGRRIIARKVDACDLAAVGTLVDQAVAELGSIDVVVINHGICSYGYVWELSEEQWAETIENNLTGVWKVIKATVPRMIAQGRGGSIIITSSTAGLRGLPLLGHYASSKHGVVGLARTLANEVGQYDIRVNTVHPVGVATVMGGVSVDGEAVDSTLMDELHIPAVAENLGPIYMNALPYRRVECEDISNAVSFLASDEARFITGVHLPVDLGTLLR